MERLDGEELDEEGLARLGRAIAPLLRPGDVVALSGELGAGKTTLARAILSALGHRGEVPSPTFTLAQGYEDLAIPVLHCDLYRLRDAAEAESLGLDDWLLSGALLVEWPERLGTTLWPERLWLRLDGAGGKARHLTCDPGPAWKDRWPPR